MSDVTITQTKSDGTEIVINCEEESMKEVIENNLKEGKIVTVTFTKKDGSQRVLRGTTNTNYIPAAPVVENTKPKRAIAANADVAKVFDLDINEWRSFRYDSVTKVEIE